MTQDDCILVERLLALFVVFLIGVIVLVAHLEQAHPASPQAAELEAMTCECVIEVVDPRVPLVSSGRAMEVW